MNNTEWKKVKLGDIIVKMGKTEHPAKDALDSGKYPFFTNSASEKKFYINDFDFDEPIILANTGGKAYFKYCDVKCSASRDLYIFKTVPDVDVKYLYYVLKDMEQDINDNGFAGAALKHLNKDYLHSREISLPPLEEQRRIASLLSRFDELIQLHEFKADNLIKAKQQIMTDIFSGGLRDLSHINLDDYVQDDWVTVKLGDIFDNISDKNYPDEEVLTIIQGKGTVKRSESGIDIKYKAESLPTYKRVLKNDFIIHLRTHQGGLEIANSTGIVSPAYNIIRCKRASFSYFKHYFRTKEFIFKLQNIAVGLREGKSIKWTDFKNIEVKIPPTIEEQQKIANLLSSYDSLIELKQSQKQQVTNMKQQLMNQLLSNGGGRLIG